MDSLLHVTGHAFIKKSMRENNAIYGEKCPHTIILEIFLTVIVV